MQPVSPGRLASIVQEPEVQPERLVSFAWEYSLQQLGIDAAHRQAKPSLNHVLEEYQDLSRRYHNIHHIGEMLGILFHQAQANSALPHLLLAATYHDVVYNPRSHDNEERSALRAVTELNVMGARQDDLRVIHDLIVSTKKHEPVYPGFVNAIFLDADLAILGAEQPRYAQYAAQIREEYAWVPDVQYREGRAKVLQNLIARPQLYLTQFAKAAFEDKARVNIASELSALASA